MMKILKKSILSGILMCVCMFSACSIWTYNVTFVDYNGLIVDMRIYSVTESVSDVNVPYGPSREGFKFVAWTYENPANVTPNGEVNTDKIMYAQYEIDPQAIIFQESGRKVQWYGSNATVSTYFEKGKNKTLLIQDGTGLGNISKVEIVPMEGSNFTCDVLAVYDANACPISLNSQLANVWNVREMEEGAYDFVIVVSPTGTGNAEIKVY